MIPRNRFASALSDKLGLLPGKIVTMLNAPPEAEQVLRAASGPGVFLSRGLRRRRYDAIFYWPRTQGGIRRELVRLTARIHPDGAIWVVMPKKAFAAQRGIDFTWEAMQAEALKTDLVDNKIAAMTNEDYATRFVIRREKRRSPP